MNLKSVVFICGILTATLFILAPAFAGGSADADDPGWPCWRGPNHDGVSAETDWDPTALDGGPKLLWSKNVGIGHSSVAIRDDVLYTMGSDEHGNYIFCMDAYTGEENWRTPVEGSELNSTPAIDGASLYCMSDRGVVYCLNRKNGKIKWQRDLVNKLQAEKIPYGFNSCPLVEGDLVILNANTYGIALDKKTGKLMWGSAPHEKCRNNQGYHATPVLYDFQDQKQLLMLGADGLTSIEPGTGERLWYYEWYNYFTAKVADPEPYDGKVFLRANYRLNSCLLLDISGSEPKLLWENQNMRNDIGTCVRVDRYLYGSDGFQGRLSLRCVDFFTGELMWEQAMHRGGTVAVAAAGDKLLVLEDDGNLRIAEATPEAYKEISSCRIPSESGVNQWWTPPVLYCGRIYCRNYSGDLVCIDVSKER